MSLSSNRAQILHEHNQYRARHRAQPLRFDDGLNSSAQWYAEMLAWHDGGLPHSRGNYGENLYFGPPGAAPTEATTLWYDEVALYNYVPGGYSWATSHFTQLVWRSSTAFGVGIAQARSGRTFVVAHYYPQGNIIGQFAENVLPPQSQNDETAAPIVNVDHSAKVEVLPECAAHQSNDCNERTQGK